MRSRLEGGGGGGERHLHTSKGARAALAETPLMHYPASPPHLLPAPLPVTVLAGQPQLRSTRGACRRLNSMEVARPSNSGFEDII